MEILNSLSENKDLSLALGFFDGVHIAHKKIINTCVNLAKENNLKSAVITFKKSPGGYFDKEKNINIQTLNDRLELISKINVDYAYVLDFEDFKNLTAKEYLNDVLIKYFSPKFIVTGFNHTFGKNKMGNSEFLYANESLGYKYIEIEKMRLDNTLISSTNIKKFIQKGYIKEASNLLGYDFNISGMVIKGMQLARNLGYKTANIKMPDNIVQPPYGVYFVLVEYEGKKYKAVLNWGIKPTVDGKTPVLEAHILDFNKDIYGENIKIYFKSPIREEKRFNNLEELKTAIAGDIECVLTLGL